MPSPPSGAQLPWVKVERTTFSIPQREENARRSLQWQSQLIVYHLMSVRSGTKPAPAARSTWDRTDGAPAHLAQRDVSFAGSIPCTDSKIEAFKKRLGWRLTGCRPTEVISTTTTTSPSLQSNWPRQGRIHFELMAFPSEERLESASSTETKTATPSTPIPPTVAGQRPR